MARARLLACGAVAACVLLLGSIGVSAQESARVTTNPSATVQREPGSDNARALFALVGIGSLAGGFFVLRRLPTTEPR